MKKFIALGVMSAIMTAPLSGLAFSDISESPHKSEIEFFEKEGIIDGKGDGRFHPKDNLTRAETAKICAGIVPRLYFEEPNPIFSDVLSTHWAVKEIGTMVYSINSLAPEYPEILPEKYNEKLFHPESRVNAKYLLDICLEILGYKANEYEPIIGYKNTMEKAYSCGLLEGVNVGEGQEITRETAMKIFYNTINAPIVITDAVIYDFESGKFITSAKVMDGSGEDTPFTSLWMYKNKKR